jgi:hypothetical protein
MRLLYRLTAAKELRMIRKFTDDDISAMDALLKTFNAKIAKLQRRRRKARAHLKYIESAARGRLSTGPSLQKLTELYPTTDDICLDRAPPRRLKPPAGFAKTMPHLFER